VLSNRKSETQLVDTIALDLTDPVAVRALSANAAKLMLPLTLLTYTKIRQVKNALKEYGTVPDILICNAGGSSPAQIGFLADLSPEGLTSCLEINYYSAIFITQACLQLWIQNPLPHRTRHVVFISSAAAFVSIPGYIAYTPPKAAIRAFADTLRQELLLYGGKDMYQVHSAFPGTFITDSFLTEQASKPELTKIMEGSNFPIEEIQAKTPSASDEAKKILLGLDKGNYMITSDLEGRLILNNMRGPSPRDGWFSDFLQSCLMMFAWPLTLRDWDKKTRNYGKSHHEELHSVGS
jgi:3-dehydrosphinganine reductase